MNSANEIVHNALFWLKCINVKAQVINQHNNGLKEAIIVLPDYRWDEECKKPIKRKGK